MNFAPVSTLADLDALDHDQVVEGYRSAERGDPEPGPNRGRAYWHGWRCRMMDLGGMPIDQAAMDLARAVVADRRRQEGDRP